MSVSEVEDVIISLDEEDNAATVPVPKGRPRGKKAATSSTSEHASESPEASTSPKRKSAAKGSSPTKEDSDRTSRAKRKVTFADESDSEDGSDQDEVVQILFHSPSNATMPESLSYYVPICIQQRPLCPIRNKKFIQI
eukprot:TRINITY_DN6444_c0_g3_i2.p1 TRINITY_DN6444_c0_g3~~TRINITY_DN6444_c0_g3_i2.p1  ORF type:complete len:138 (+),score=27.12 TRINITY_DN6444_c0_g3_i2:57-470(+)